MVIQLSCIGRAQPSDLGAILPALAEAAEAVDLDHSRLAFALDWVQYRRNFRAPVMVRPFSDACDTPLAEIAIDVRRAKDLPHEELVREIVNRLSKALGLIPDVHECIHLEDWVRPSKSVIWAFNRSYWRHLAAWDSTFQKDYAAALPGGVSDGTNPRFWREQIETFIQTLDRLDEWSERPDEIHVLEFGVGDSRQSKVWLDTFAALGRDYLGRIRYLMADCSPHVLARARERVAPYADRVECLELDFRSPIHGLAHLRGKLLFAHTCNLYDNLPTDELMRVGERAYEPLVRASITPREVAELAAVHGIAQHAIVPTVQQVLRHGPEFLGDVERGVRFWSDVQTLALLHHEGVLVAQDIFVREISQYAAYRGPGKLEGSIVNWLNGPVFQLVGERCGFRVSVEPFPHRRGSNTVVLNARPRDAYTVESAQPRISEVELAGLLSHKFEDGSVTERPPV